MDDLKWFIGFLIFFIIAWVMGGGVMRDVASPFIAPPVPVGERSSATKTGSLPKDLKAIAEKSGASSLKGVLELSVNNYGSASAAEEYITLQLSESASARVLLTGMTIKSDASGRSATVGKGAYLPQQGTVNAEEPVYLEPGGTAFVVTGRSPTGSSFRVNKCTGYFEQFQNFVPQLPIECPLPKKEPLPPPPNSLSDACLEYIDNMRRCRIEPNPPETLGEECRRFIRDSFTYPRCVVAHKSDPDFYKNEWHLYLSRDLPLWKSTREVIKLFDATGKPVDAVTY
ncbi:MAG: hypothetical protein G01um101417_178 [Parcubacteria group bacterium Gr01-1014_17]|nr:MAG: hypothetical protein G01um101417_178 [Parcubacteria group bacterium Gr01-1014_17]